MLVGRSEVVVRSLWRCRRVSANRAVRSSSSSPSLSSSPRNPAPLHPDPETAARIERYARMPQTSASLQTLMRTGRGELLRRRPSDDENHNNKDQDHDNMNEPVLRQVAGFLRRELPIRLARRVVDLHNVPYLRDMDSVREVKELYASSFADLVETTDDDVDDDDGDGLLDEADFARLVEGVYERHAAVLVQMARGAFELRRRLRNEGEGGGGGKRGRVSFDRLKGPHEFLDRFYVSRIGIRVLIGQYLSLRQPPLPDYVGIICSRTSPYEIVRRATDDASFMCVRRYGDAPEVVISGRLDLSFPYVPTHLHYIMLELLKNSMRATMDWHDARDDDEDGGSGDYPPIKVVIADGAENEDVVIKVADEGGGIPRSHVSRIWSYLFTTADPAVQEGMVSFDEKVDHSIDSPMAGLGYGLPISRSYARYFGGDLSLMSMEGYGTDAFVYLTRLGNTKEPLPS